MSFFKKLFRCSKKDEKENTTVNESENETCAELSEESLAHVSAAGDANIGINNTDKPHKNGSDGKGMKGIR